jgi:hypothetical protein
MSKLVLKINELFQTKPDGGYFVRGDQVKPMDWANTGQYGSIRIGNTDGQTHLREGQEVYNIKFVDGTEVNLSWIQLFSILNDYDFKQIDRDRWTLHGLDKDSWKGTVRKEPVSESAVQDSKLNYEFLSESEEE